MVRLTNKQMAKSVNVQFRQAFISTAGKLAPFIALLLLILGVALVHDTAVGLNYAREAQLSGDTRWGGLMVSVDLEKREVREPTEAGTGKIPCQRPANDPPGRIFDCPSSGFITWDFPETPGSVEVEGRIYIKNRYWLRSVKIPTDLLQLKYGKQSGTPKVDGFTLGRFLSARKGVSGTFKFEDPYSAKDGKLYLQHGAKSVELR